MQRKKLSLRQQKMLGFIRQFMEDNPHPPTVRDIQEACAISSTSVVDYNLRLLNRDGYLRRRPDVARGIELLDEEGRTASASQRISVMGYISAGEPLPGPSSDGWAHEPLEILDIPKNLADPQKNPYALKVKGLSMIDALINDGDLVIVEPTQDIRDGDMVVAWLKLEEETTLKHIYFEGQQIRLQPANSQMNPIYANASNVETRGKVVGVLRTL